MTAQVQEIIEITKRLPSEKVAQVLEFARALAQAPFSTDLSQLEGNAIDGDGEWERIINDPRGRPKLSALVKPIKAEMRNGKQFEPLDLDKL